MTHVAITGATGLVGSNLANYLVQKNYQVTALVRSKVKASSLLQKQIQIVEVDILHGKSLETILQNVDVVVHAAGMVDPYGSKELIFKTNVEGTRTVLQSAKEAAVQQFIFISSLSVITGFTDQFAVTEEAPLQKCGEAYADSKVEAELLLMGESQIEKIAVTILRPGFIYGPGETAWLPRLISSIRYGKAMLIGGGNRESNVIYVENLNSAIEGALLNKKAFGQIYNLTDGQKVSKKQLFDSISDGLGLPRVTKVVPYGLAKAFCQLVSGIAPFLPIERQKSLARYSKAAFRLAGLNQGFSIDKAERDLHYVNRIPFAQGMARTLLSFQKSAEIPRSPVSSDAKG
jgi:nucleoside-diphosphate-sugar epimerase